MNPRLHRWIPVLLVLACLAPTAARAQGPGYRFEITPTAGFRFGGSLDGRSSDLFDDDLDVADDLAYGVTFDIPLSSDLQLELLASRQETELRFARDLFGGATELADFDVSYYHLGLLWQFGDRRVSPFFVVGAGVATLSPDLPGASSETRFSASVGGGVKVFLSESVGLRFEGRGFVSDFAGGERRHEGRCGSWNDDCYGADFSQGQASIGLILAF